MEETNINNQEFIAEIITNQIPCYFVSPHLDDAIFSAGGLMSYLSDKVEITVINIFTSVGDGKSTLSAKQYLKQCQVNNSERLFELRITEDQRALSKINAKVYNLGYIDGLWRKLKHPRIIRKLIGKFIPEFDRLYPTYKFHIISEKIAKEDGELIEEIKKKLNSIVKAKDKNFRIFCPIGFGKHIDHLIVRNACYKAFKKNLIYWSDFPNCLSLKKKNDFIKTNNFEQYRFEIQSNDKIDLCEQYISQINQVIGDRKKLYKPEVFYLNNIKVRNLYVVVNISIDDVLLEKWRKLWEDSQLKNYFNSPNWFLACQKTFNYSEAVFITCYEESKMVGILPLVRTKKYGVMTYSGPGNQYSDRSSLLMVENDSDILNEITENLTKLNSFYINEIDESMAIRLLNKYSGNIKVSISSDSPYLDISTNPYRYFNTDNKRRIIRKIENERENLKCEMYFGITAPLMQIIRKIESQSTKIIEHKDIFSNREFIKLNQNLSMLDHKSILIYILFYQGEPICYQYGFVYDHTYSCCNTAYKISYRYLFPGKILIFLFIPELIKMGINILDFSRGRNIFKRDFTPYTRSQYSVYGSSYFIVTFWWNIMNTLLNKLEKYPKLFETIRKIKNLLINSLLQLQQKNFCIRQID